MASTTLPPPSSTASEDDDASKRLQRKEVFGDCALVEIIHLHDCLRGALKALQRDVSELSQLILLKGENDTNDTSDNVFQLERRVAGRFKVIWSVFRAHSAAEDEFIWPALQSKQKKDIKQEQYEEDHADEEQMFRTMDILLTKLRAALMNQQQQPSATGTTTVVEVEATDNQADSIKDMARSINDLTAKMEAHLLVHLEKEETNCMPLVKHHLTKSEINELVGQIMGKRSSDTIAQIMTMAVQNLNDNDQEEMVRHMKQAMVGTFFERWLAMSGWMKDTKSTEKESPTSEEGSNKRGNDKVAPASKECQLPDQAHKRPKLSETAASSGTCSVAASADSLLSTNGTPVCVTCSTENGTDPCPAAGTPKTTISKTPVGDALAEQVLAIEGGGVTSQAELEKLIRAIASNPELDSVKKTTTIQGLRDSVWKSNQRERGNRAAAHSAPLTVGGNPQVMQQQHQHVNMMLTTDQTSIQGAPVSAAATKGRRGTPPSLYYKKNPEGKTELVWSSVSPSSKLPTNDKTIPLFSASELAPTYHHGATGSIRGCPHYARGCKLRHPSSGRLYPCRLCCEQEREMPMTDMKDKDSPLDRFAVTEILCMECNALQPASDKCVNTKCQTHVNSFAKYSCNICNFYAEKEDIYHCPFCNVCRTGKGLGIDYRHCMRCNACVSLADDEHHCIPQRLQGSCPICHESMFESIEPLRGMKCGHVMHLSCFSMYMRGNTCELQHVIGRMANLISTTE